MTIQTLTEFALRYTSVSGASNPDTKIIINSIFDGVNVNHHNNDDGNEATSH